MTGREKQILYSLPLLSPLIGIRRFTDQLDPAIRYPTLANPDLLSQSQFQRERFLPPPGLLHNSELIKNKTRT